MKKTLTIIALALLISLNSSAIVRTVSNSPSGGAQYPDLLSAYNNSSNGDTLLIEPTATTYGSGYINWGKKLTVIGIGFNAATQHGLKTNISGLLIETASAGSYFYGINVIGAVSSGQTMTNITFTDCYIGSFISSYCCGNQTTFTGCSFINCIFGGNIIFGPNANANITFISCIFNNIIDGYNNSTQTSINIDHSLFLFSGTPINNLLNATISNSIFLNCTNVTSNCTGNSFINNIVESSFALPSAGNIGTGNLSSSNPQFTTYTAGQLYSSAHNYHLQTSSPAIGTASDGSDIGPHGSITHFSESGEVLINPIMRTMIINNTTLAPNGNLNVNINATKPTDN